ncbi:dihydroneopterin triphosphate pyrophosphatase [Anaerotignum neopropionicum]|uniref:Dihydroneopterin triphosphate pyrophosphatase n=1 Tax=Anaerotignum neopropionicum TaxID=36847 RepID=A0A136WD80_9FIRM|nr:NUDIX domain-containing protein [Anaerotignum neopropionicum]KXL52467.1 dihydroneopterin triphosphate pyrophosphatase [Anaerotignum neopropionicum]
MDILELVRAYQPYNMEEEKEKEIVLELLDQRREQILFRSFPFVHATATAMVFNEKKDKVLMIKHNIFDTWACVGGHADGKSDLMWVAKKELQEETGVVEATPISREILSLDILLVAGHYKNEAYVPNHLHINATFGFIANENVKLTIKADENSDVAWIPLEEINSYCKEVSFVKVYKKIIEKIIY